MNDSTTQTPAKALKPVAGNMPARSIFSTPVDAVAFLNRCTADYSDFATIPIVSPGVNAEGVFDPAIYDDKTNIMVSVLRNVATAEQKKNGIESTVKAIVVIPSPKIDSVLESEAGRSWLEKIYHKEINHVAVRALRTADNLANVADQVPTTLDGFISSGRESSAGIMDTFNKMFRTISEWMAAKSNAWKRAKPALIKQELRRCFESKAYALDSFETLEDRGEDKPSLFVAALVAGTAMAKKDGLDPTIFERWLATRDAKTFTAEEEEDDDFDFDSITEELLSEPAAVEANTESAVPATA